MPTLTYRLLDVFAERVFGGNQLAVFDQAPELPAATMQTIARELNLSETTFVTPTDTDDADYRVRIFTPAMELPMAGHPTVGTAHVLSEGGDTGEPRFLRLEEAVGLIPVEVRFQNGSPDLILMQQPLPEFADSPLSRAHLARLLGLGEDALDPDLPAEIGSAGVPFQLIPVRDAAALAGVRLDLQFWEEELAGSDAPHIYVFRRGGAAGEIYSRMFAPAMSIPEDPATGAAAGPVAAYAVRHGLTDDGDPVAVTVRQGIEMGRPSLIEALVDREDDRVVRVRIGGRCKLVGRGEIELPAELA